MGTVVAFAPTARAARRAADAAAPASRAASQAAPQGPAQVLLFLGVRYERDADASAPRPAAARPADRRRLG